MEICIGTSKGVVIVNPLRPSAPVMVLADPFSVWCMALDGGRETTIYAGAVDHRHLGCSRGRSSLARSTDRGRSWSDITPALARDEDVWALAAVPGRPGDLCIGTSQGRLLRSRDSGRSFAESAAFAAVLRPEPRPFATAPHNSRVRSIVFDRNSPSTFYLGVQPGGVFRSTDDGRSFERLNRGLAGDIQALAVEPNEPGRLYAATSRGLFVSDSHASRWRHAACGSCECYGVALFASPFEPALFAATAAGPPSTWQARTSAPGPKLLRSTDGANTFSEIAQPHGPIRGVTMKLRGDPANPYEVLSVSSDGTLARTTDRGLNLLPLAQALPPAFDFVALP
ncbi:MAG: hypothetical protein M1336_02815 [Deltaproteobacteria bacterium]|nr:hypothetical protein [Deltaproteobacteria bacterium]